MLFILIFVCLLNIQILIAKPINDDIPEYSNIRTENGYQFHFATPNQIIRYEKGTIGADSDGNQILRVVGSFSYITPEGQNITVRFKADENGYIPKISYELTPPRPVSGYGLPVEKPIDAKTICSLCGGGLG